MIYVYVDSVRMAYVQKFLNAETLEDVDDLKYGDTIVFPILKKTQRKLFLKKGELILSSLRGLNLYVPFPYSFINENNNVYYYMRDEFLVSENAKLTALGMLSFLGSLELSLKDECFDIIGNGKCGKAINKALKSIDCKTRVIRRENDDDNNIGIEQYKLIEKGSVLINTAPYNILNYEHYSIAKIKYIIDISSEHCIKKEEVPNYIEVIYPGSLPNLYCSYASAVLISDYVKGKENEK